MDDKEIVALLCERSEEALKELQKKYGALCTRVAFNILGSREDAEECVNDACLAVWNTVPPQSPDPLSAYFCRIVRNLAIKKYHENSAKKRNGRYDASLEELGDCIPALQGVEDALFYKETARALNAFLGTLDRESRMLFVRRYWYSDPIEDLARAFHTGRHNVSVRLSRIRKKLKKYLEENGVLL